MIMTYAVGLVLDTTPLLTGAHIPAIFVTNVSIYKTFSISCKTIQLKETMYITFCFGRIRVSWYLF